MRPRSFLSLVMAASLAGGCTTGPDHVRPAPPPSLALDSGTFLRARGTAGEAPADRWWETMGDAELSRLIAEGLARSPRMAAAEARMRQARSRLARARAARLPVAGLSGLVVHADLPEDAFGTGTQADDTLYAAGFDASWEIDLWGGSRRAGEAARADAQAAQAKLEDERVLLSAEIARSYVELRESEHRLGLLERRLELETALADLIRQRRRGGTAPQQAVEAAQQRLLAARTAMELVRSDASALRDGLAVLTGAAPGALDAMARGDVPLPPASVAVADPAAMLARRPDLRAAQARLAAAGARIGVAQARRLPAVSLMGMIGIGGTSPDDLVSSSSLASLAIPRLNWSFLDFGRSLAALREARAVRDEALADYEAAVLNALRDAEASLGRFGAARAAYGNALAMAESAQKVAGLDAMRARSGTLSRADAIEAQLQGLDAQVTAGERRAQLGLAYVALAKALGLGWPEPESAPKAGPAQ